VAEVCVLTEFYVRYNLSDQTDTSAFHMTNKTDIFFGAWRVNLICAFYFFLSTKQKHRKQYRQNCLVPCRAKIGMYSKIWSGLQTQTQLNGLHNYLIATANVKYLK